jgi:aminoglycoside 3-N-acetyltransferase
MKTPYLGEAEAVARTTGPPATIGSLADDLGRLGLREGSTVLVHSSLSALGWVVGGAEAVVLGLEKALGSEGTLMMPAYSMNGPEPSAWQNPPVPEPWWQTIREEWPPFDRDLSPSLRLGAIAETFRKQRGTERSLHPNDSFCARGPNARRLLDHHSLDDGLGEGSPLGRLYDLRGEVLLLGVDHSSNSSFHLAEYRAKWPSKPISRTRRARMTRDGSVVSVDFRDLDLSSDDFGQLGEDLEAETAVVKIGRVALATGRLMEQRTAVDFALRWIEAHRGSA